MGEVVTGPRDWRSEERGPTSETLRARALDSERSRQVEQRDDCCPEGTPCTCDAELIAWTANELEAARQGWILE